MSADLTAVITQAVADSGAGDGGSPDTGSDTSNDADTGADSAEAGSDAGSAESTESEGDTGDSSASDSGQETGHEAETEPEAEEAPVEDTRSQLDKDLEELGIKAPKPGERENRLPHSRVRKIAENYGKKVEARFTQEISNLKASNTRLAKAGQTLKNIDNLLDSGEAGVDRFMQLMATVHPGKFDRYLGNAKAGKAAGDDKPAVAKSVADLGPEPQPDVVYADKSRGYTPEQHAKLMKWTRDVAKAEAKAEALSEMEARMEAKYGKIAKTYEQHEALQAEIPRVRQVVDGVYETWGKDLVDKHEDAIVALMEQYPDMPTAEAVARILVPQVRADRNRMRQGLIKETHARTAAAAKIGANAGTANRDSAEPKSLEDVIRHSIAASGIKR